MQINLVKATFEDLNLIQRDSEKLRGFFLNINKENDYFHNHNENDFIYRYPLVQYKIVDTKPMIIGIEEAVEPVLHSFISNKEIILDNKKYSTNKKTINLETFDIKIINDMKKYEFISPYLALNQKNSKIYKSLSNTEKKIFLEKILVGNILSFLKSFNIFISEKIICSVDFVETTVELKNIKYISFKGSFKVNMVLPSYIGLGKAVSKGFGTIKQ